MRLIGTPLIEFTVAGLDRLLVLREAVELGGGLVARPKAGVAVEVGKTGDWTPKARVIVATAVTVGVGTVISV